MGTEKHLPGHCVELFEKLSDYIDGELDQMTCKEIEKHIDECIPCKICLATLKKTIHFCKKMEPEPVPKDFSKRLADLIDDLQRQDGGTTPLQKPLK